MGLFDNPSGFFSDVGHWFDKAANDVYNTATNIVTTLHDDVKGVVTGVGNIANNTVTKAITVVEKGENIIENTADNALNIVDDATKGISNFLSSPGFLLVAAGGLYFLINQRK